jgi:hypothetical protein
MTRRSYLLDYQTDLKIRRESNGFHGLVVRADDWMVASASD